MINLQWLVGPGVGAVIGYITNDVAVRMLFRPREAKYLFGKRVPLTPGLIPKSRFRLSQAVGGLVGSELLSGEVLRKALLSDGMRQRVGSAMDELFAKTAGEERGVRELVKAGWGGDGQPAGDDDSLEDRIEGVIGTLSGQLSERLIQSGFEVQLADSVVSDLRTRITTTPLAPLRLFWDERFQKAMVERLAKAIRDMASEHGQEWVGTIIRSAVNEALDTKVSEWYVRVEPYLPQVKAAVMGAYERLVSEQLERALAAIDLGEILRAHIDSLDAAEMERMILRIMKRELRAIVWLGALLGAVMGIVNAVIPL
ncbi:MAG: DUF445 family protein [Oscillospiraceae bacterium]|jgi:uncharacterized membrane protein YheB (UPF0754 family)|nr:DUF445 family protein [Oscillospiraceae bacterium]